MEAMKGLDKYGEIRVLGGMEFPWLVLGKLFFFCGCR